MKREGAAPAAESRSDAPAAGATPLPSRRRQLIGLLRAASILLAIILAAEVAARVEDWVAYGTSPFSRVTSIEDLVTRDAEGMHGRASVRFQKWRMDSLGLRGPEVPVNPDGAFRVITVGASETFGLMESPGKEYPRQLEDSLQARLRRHACPAIPANRVEVLNAAFAGMSLPTIEQDLRLRLRRLHPDMVVVYPAPVGYLEDQLPRAARPDSSQANSPFPWSRVFHLRLLDRARAQVKQTLPERLMTIVRRIQTERSVQAHRLGWRFTTVPADRLAAYDRDLRQLVFTIRQLGAVPLLVTHANAFMGRARLHENKLQAWEKFYPRATGATIVAFDSAARVRTLAAAHDSAVAVVDAGAAFSRQPESDFGDFVHFTDAGSAEMANLLANAICSHAGTSGPYPLH